MSSKDKIKSFLICRGSALNYEIAQLLEGQPGQLSTGQRLREIRKELQAEGGDLSCEEERPGVYRYTVIKPHPQFKQDLFAGV